MARGPPRSTRTGTVFPCTTLFRAHKAGLLGLTKTLAGELAAEGIRVNCVAPGRTLTPLWTKRAAAMAAERGSSAESVLEEFSRDIPLQRFGSPEERSEEHTSELQSLMRISYAVFCLKKKKDRRKKH